MPINYTLFPIVFGCDISGSTARKLLGRAMQVLVTFLMVPLIILNMLGELYQAYGLLFSAIGGRLDSVLRGYFYGIFVWHLR